MAAWLNLDNVCHNRYNRKVYVTVIVLPQVRVEGGRLDVRNQSRKK